MAAKLAVFLFLNLLLFAVVHGCVPNTPYCADPVVPSGQCPINTLKLKVCVDVLNRLKLRIGVPESEECCPLLKGLVDVDAAACLCTVLNADVPGIINLNLPIDLSLLLNQCRGTTISDFTCPSV